MYKTAVEVSIHAFRGEGDPSPRRMYGRVSCFNPRLPGGRRPFLWCRYTRIAFVSIHAFRGEGDRARHTSKTVSAVFQSTPSGGKATCTPQERGLFKAFQSTPSGGKATAVCAKGISCRARFNPRLPGGRRPEISCSTGNGNRFNPRLPGGRRHVRTVKTSPVETFQSTPSGGKAT